MTTQTILEQAVMTFLIFVDLYVALAQIVICTIIFGVLWKKMNDKYGA